MKILNTWSSTKQETKYCHVENPVYQNGDYAIYKLASSHLHVFQNVAINELVAANKNLIDHLADPKNTLDVRYSFICDRAKNIIKKYR